MLSKRIAIMQPTYLPWLGYFDLIRNVDVFVIYDHVQFEKRSWQQRNRIRDAEKEIMLTVPVETKSRFDQPIYEVKIDKTQKFITKHLNSIKFNYSKSRNFNAVYPKLEEIYLQEQTKLIDLNLDLINLGMESFKITTPLIKSTSLHVEGNKVDALVDICKKLFGTEYLSPIGSKAYIDENNLFPQYNITLTYQNFNHPIYKQINYNNFISHLSFIDYLFNADRLQF